MTMDGQLLLYLPSSVKGVSGNTAGRFSVPLSKPIVLPGRWEIGLTEFFYTKSWHNVTAGQNRFFLRHKNVLYALSLEPGHYEEVEGELLKRLNGLIDKTVKNQVYFQLKDGKIQFKLDHSNSLYFYSNSRLSRLMGATTPHTTSPWVSYDASGIKNRHPQNERLMGLKPSDFVVMTDEHNKYSATVTGLGNVHFKDQYPSSDRQLTEAILLACRDLGDAQENQVRAETLAVMRTEPNLETIPKLYVYASNVRYVHVGNAEAPLLRIVPVKGKRGEHVHVEFQKVIFIPILPATLSDFAIKITTEQGDVVDFTQGETVCTLVARQMV